MKFVPMPKIPRLEREIIITEKLDGTNANILIQHITEAPHPAEAVNVAEDMFITAGSRTRWLTPGKNTDNFGFAAWVHANAEQLVKLGPGHHFGEWWGQGIQRGYDLKERRFSLFNVSRWSKEQNLNDLGLDNLVHVVPHMNTLTSFNKERIDEVLAWLDEKGSAAAPGYMNPEGIVIYHTASKQLYKKTFEGDETGKGQ